ncbi:50S ribosomal protein L21e [Candidatus Bathyarchaeota archaeon]|jgi:large subunit ribosomal protein L21e|nr:MAG: 50S ribosomal protein L21e [Candidatus Bathyarchaeota archaeon]
MARSHGFRRGHRKILTKRPRNRGMQPLGRLLHVYNFGDKTVLKIDPSVHKGMPHARYQGKVGIIQEKRGSAYVIHLEEGHKTRCLIVRPEHLVPYSN